MVVRLSTGALLEPKDDDVALQLIEHGATLVKEKEDKKEDAPKEKKSKTS